MNMGQNDNNKIEKKGKNVIYFPMGCEYGICYFRNVDSYFIFDIKYLEKIKKHTWTARIRKNGKIDAYTKINGKTVYLTKYLMDTPVEEGFKTDHINGETRDNRECNLRKVTAEMNMLNRKKGKALKGE